MNATNEAGKSPFKIPQDVYDALDAHQNTRDWWSRKLTLVGSTAVNGAGNDIDVVVEHGDLTEAAGCLADAGWEINTAEVYRGIAGDGWFSAKLDTINLLVSEPYTAQLWYIGNSVCLAYRALVNRDTTKEERVALHKAVFND